MLKSCRSNLLLVLITCLSGLSCKDRIVAKDGSSSKNSPDLDFPKDFVRLKKEFDRNRHGKIDSMKKIPQSLMKAILKNDFDSSYNTSVNPVALIENGSGYFFIIRENCIAGGDCATFCLSAFDRKGRFCNNSRIGRFMVDASGITSFKYKIMADTGIVTYESNYDLAKGMVIDSITKHITLTLPESSF